jgi:hypothetical protein
MIIQRRSRLSVRADYRLWLAVALRTPLGVRRCTDVKILPHEQVCRIAQRHGHHMRAFTADLLSFFGAACFEWPTPNASEALGTNERVPLVRIIDGNTLAITDRRTGRRTDLPSIRRSLWDCGGDSTRHRLVVLLKR